jgi:hypothetical protein
MNFLQSFANGQSQTFSLADIQNPDHEGYLVKRSLWLGEWRRRYFVLKGTKLYFAKEKGAAPHGVIDLKGCFSLKSAEDVAKKPNCFEVGVAEGTFYLYASSEREKDEWMSKIGEATTMASDAFIQEGPLT